MKKIILAGFFLILIAVSLVSAEPNLEIEKVSKGDAIINEFNQPAVFDFIVDNNGEADYFQIYSLVGVSMYPKGLFYLPKGKTTIEVRAYPNSELKKIRGYLNFEYQLRGENSGIFKDKLLISIVPFKESLRVFVDDILPNDKEVNVNIENIKNAYIENLDIRFQSEFFDFSRKISFKPHEKLSFRTAIDSEEIRNLVAGIYVVTAAAKAGGVKERFDGLVNYLEREGIAVNKTSSGFIVRKTIITKTNVGNVPNVVNIEVNRDIFTRLFTGYSINPAVSDRGGFSVGYLWKKELQPGESYSVISSTNYTIPFILIILIALTGVAAKMYNRTPVLIVKRVSYVKAKGGEMALKVKVYVKARDAVSNVALTDYVPISTKLYENFGKKPDKVGENARMLGWNVGNLNSGEERIFSYIVYSNLKVVGRFELPLASAVYERNGSKNHVFSNKTYFVAETTSVDAL